MLLHLVFHFYPKRSSLSDFIFTQSMLFYLTLYVYPKCTILPDYFYSKLAIVNHFLFLPKMR